MPFTDSPVDPIRIAGRVLRRTSCALAVSALCVAAAVAGIADTPHNLIDTGRALPEGTDPSAVCAFCHTPNGRDESTPLWQRTSRDGSRGYAMFDSFGRSNLDGVEQKGSVSMSCMSCHDGTQAINVATTVIAGGSAPAIDRRTGSMIDPSRDPIRIDQSVSHPVGMPYGAWADVALDVGGGEWARGGVPGPAEQIRRGFREPESDTIDGVTVWWLETGTAGRQRGDIHLYSRRAAEGEPMPFVECSSCHDPHAEARNFLRGERADTALCASCHAL